MMHKVEIGDEIEWQGRMRKVKKLLGITVALDGVEDVICLPMDATRAEVFKDAGTDENEEDEYYRITFWGAARLLLHLILHGRGIDGRTRP